MAEQQYHIHALFATPNPTAGASSAAAHNTYQFRGHLMVTLSKKDPRVSDLSDAALDEFHKTQVVELGELAIRLYECPEPNRPQAGKACESVGPSLETTSSLNPRESLGKMKMPENLIAVFTAVEVSSPRKRTRAPDDDLDAPPAQRQRLASTALSATPGAAMDQFHILLAPSDPVHTNQPYRYLTFISLKRSITATASDLDNAVVRCIRRSPRLKINADSIELGVYKLAEPIRPIEATCRSVEEAYKHVDHTYLYDKALSIFGDEPLPNPDYVVVVILGETATQKRPGEAPDRAMRLREDTIQHAPSSLAIPEIFTLYQQRYDDEFIYDFSPTTRPSSIPATLLHQEFGEFVDTYTKCVSSASDNDFLRELNTKMTGDFESEIARAEAFRDLLGEHYNIKLVATLVENTPYTTDGHLVVGGHWSCVTKVKKNFASQTNPEWQCGLYYGHHLKGLSRKPEKLHGSVLPCICITHHGDRFTFHAALYSDNRVRMEPLTTTIQLKYSQDPQLLARCFGALAEATRRLERYYKEELPAIQQLPREEQPDPDYPYRCYYHPLNTDSVDVSATAHSAHPSAASGPSATASSSAPTAGAAVPFRYILRISNKLLFLGETVTTKESIMIKFVRRYSREVHVYCSDMGFAPRMRAFEVLPGGWFMVVMDCIDLDSYRLLPAVPRTPSQMEAIARRVREMADALRGKRFVHGDIRGSNLMVQVGEEGVLDVKLVDFDWAGREGEVRYPANVNRVQVVRPEGAKDGELITAAHDSAMVDWLFFGK